MLGNNISSEVKALWVFRNQFGNLIAAGQLNAKQVVKCGVILYYIKVVILGVVSPLNYL